MALLPFLKNKEKVRQLADQKKTDESAAVEVPKIIFRGKSNKANAIISSPHITERANDLGILKKYVFRVASGANKIMVAQAVKELYGVSVRDVAIINTRAKKRRRGAQIGHRPGYKKAIVTVGKNDTIELV